MVRIPLRNHAGEAIAYALVDDRDAHLALLPWHLDKGYARRCFRLGGPGGGPTRSACLHREIVGLELGDPRQVDHINRDRLDCRRENLRIVWHAENCQNVPPRSGATSAHRGVHWHARANKWQATVRVGGRSHYLGLFVDESEAASAASAFRAKYMPFSEDAAA